MNAWVREVRVAKSETGAAEFYVVGGPLQPDRPCYVRRPADDALYEHLLRGECCYVLAPRQSGKTSLMAQTASRLRAERRLAVVVDLSQIGSREHPDDSGRWYYGIAYRIVRELKLKVDLQTWWQDKDNLTTLQRLTEFFRQIVLDNISVPVTVFFDEIDSTLGRGFAGDFYASLRACYDARATEPEFSRLTLVLLGVAVPVELAPDQGHAPFNISHRIDLMDFSLEHAVGLTRGLYLPQAVAARALRRIFYWTGGQPYLTQKSCRAVSRRGVSDAVERDVDKLVAEQFLTPRATMDEPNLAHVRTYLLRNDRSSSQVIRFYRLIRRGKRVYDDPVSPNLARLKLSGLVTTRRGRNLVVRNRIYARVFDLRWVANALPFRWRPFTRKLAAVTAVIAAIIWYTQYLPRPYIETLKRVTEEHELAVEAYKSLWRIPGFASRAEMLFADVQKRRSLRAVTYIQARDADETLRGIGGYDDRADELMAGFWDRLAGNAEAREQRDRALLARLRALGIPDESRRRAAARLIGSDYQRLVASIRPDGRVENFAIGADGGLIATVASGNKVQVWSAATDWQPVGDTLSVTAGEFVGIRRHASFDSDAAMRGLRLQIALSHARVGDLYVALTSPSGKEVEIRLPESAGDGAALTFSRRSHPEFVELDGDPLRGAWSLTIEDQVPDIAGHLLSWRLATAPGGGEFEELFDNGVAIPDPRETEQVVVTLSGNARYAAAVDRNVSARGYISVWDLAAGSRAARIYKKQEETHVAFDQAGQYLITMPLESRQRIDIWVPSTGQLVGSLKAWRKFDGLPVISDDGRRLAIADTRSDGRLAARVFNLPGAAALTSITLTEPDAGMALNGNGTRLAIVSGNGTVRLWNIATRGLIGEVPHPAPVTTILFSPDAAWLCTVDESGSARLWDLNEISLAQPAFESAAMPLGRPQFSSDSKSIIVQAAAHTFEVRTLPEGLRLGPRLRHSPLSDLTSDESALQFRPVATGFVDTQSRLVVTGGDDASLRVWQLAERDITDHAAANQRVETARIVDAYLSPDGRHQLTAMSNGELRIARLGDDDSRVMLAGEGPYLAEDSSLLIRAFSFSADGSTLLGGGRDGSVRFWNLATGEEMQFVTQFGGGEIIAMQLSRDGLFAAAADAFGVHVWRRETEVIEHSFGTPAPVLSLAIDPGSRLVAGGTREGEVHLWNGDTGESVAILELGQAVSALMFFEDGSVLAAGGQRGRLRFWTSGDLRQSGDDIDLGGRILSLAISTGGTLIAQTDHWLHRLQPTESGYQYERSHMLDSPVSAGAWRIKDNAGNQVSVLKITPAKTVDATTMRFDPGSEAQLPGDPARLLSEWQQKLQLKFDDNGDLVLYRRPTIVAESEEAVNGEQ
ncbi:MAG: AAA-like domain-containing protein [Gammaproteobacteria bacterium]